MTPAERALAWAGAGALLLACLTFAPLLLLRGPTVTWMTVVTHRWEGADRVRSAEARLVARAEAVRRSVDPLHPVSARVPSRSDARAADDASSALHAAGLTDEEISHLADVRGVFGLAGRLLVGSVVALALTLLPGPPGSRLARLGLAAGWALLLGAGLAAVLVAFGALAFEPLFAGFHSVFFEAGTWVFPADSVLIQTFPERFWALGAAAWAVLTLAVLGAVWTGVELTVHVRASRRAGRVRVRE